MLNAKIRNMSARQTHETDRLSKPRPVQQTGKYFGQVRKYLDTLPPLTPIKCLLAHKADGRSGYCVRNESENNRLDVFYRTVSGKKLLSLPHPESYLCKEALTRDASLHFEVCAMLYGKQELGHYYVEAAVNAFVKNGYTNKGPLHLHLQVFGLGSIQIGGEERTPRSPPLALLQEMLVPGNGLFTVVPFQEYTISMYKGEMLFRDKSGNVVAADHAKFCQLALDDAQKKGAEGKVLSVPDEVFEQKGAQFAPPAEADGFGTNRSRAALKVKHEFTGQFLAAKVDYEDEKGGTGDVTTRIHLFRKLATAPSPNGEDLVYAGDATDHPILTTYLAGKLPMTSRGYTRRSNDVAPYAVQVELLCANITRNGYVLGVKFYGTSRKVLDLSQLTDTLTMAAGNAHFRSTKQAQEALKREMADLEDEETQFRKKTKSARPAARKAVAEVLVNKEITTDEEEEAPTAAKRAKTLEAEKEGFKTGIIDGSRYRELTPAPVVYVNGKGWLGPMKLFFLRKWIHFLGGNPVHQPGPDVTIVIDHPKSIARLPDPLCVCADIQRQCHATVRFTTVEGLPALLRNNNNAR